MYPISINLSWYFFGLILASILNLQFFIISLSIFWFILYFISLYLSSLSVFHTHTLTHALSLSLSLSFYQSIYLSVCLITTPFFILLGRFVLTFDSSLTRNRTKTLSSCRQQISWNSSKITLIKISVFFVSSKFQRIIFRLNLNHSNKLKLKRKKLPLKVLISNFHSF